MEMKFSSDLMKIVFEDGESFAGRCLLIGGEALSNGFDAAMSSAKWLVDHNRTPVEKQDLDAIRKMIEADNQKHSFKILFMEE